MKTVILKGLLLGAVLCGVPSLTEAAKLFPPDNSAACAQSGGVLWWDAGQVDGNTSPGGVKCIGLTTLNCPTGQVMTGLASGLPVCVPQTEVTNVACPAGQVLVSISKGTQSTCANPVAGFNGSCPGGQVLVSINGGSPACADPSPDVSIASCPSGTAMTGISNGHPVCAAMTSAGGFPKNHAIIGNTSSYFGCMAWTDENGTAYMSDEYQGNGATNVTTNHIATFGHACPGEAVSGICMVDVTGLTNTCNRQFYPW